MEADLFALKKKPGTAPAQTKSLGNEGPKKDSTALESKADPEGAGNSVHSVPCITNCYPSYYYKLRGLC